MKTVKCSIAAIAIAASQLAAASGGDTWRYTGASYKSDAFSQAQYWTDNNGTGSVGASGAALNAEDYYLVANWKVFWTPASQEANTTFTFGGKRLTLGELGTGKTAGYMELRNYTYSTIAYFPDDGVVMARGWIKARGYKTREHPLDGKMLVTAPASAPFMLGARNSYPDQILTLKGALSGDATVALLVSNFIQDDLATNVTVKLSGDCSGYYGSISVTGTLARTATQYGAALSLAAVTMPGSVTIENDGVLRTAAITDIAAVGSLTLKPGSCIALQTGSSSGHTTNGFFRVTDSFTATGPVAVTLPSSIVSYDGNTLDGSTLRLPVVEVPLGATLSTNDFVIEYSDATAVWPLEWFHLEIEEGTTTKRLVLVKEPIVRQTANDTDTYSLGFGTSLTNAANWLDSNLPHEGCNYIIHGRFTKLLRSLSDTSLDYVFPGGSLTLFHYADGRSASFFLLCHSFYVPFFCSISTHLAAGSHLPVAILRADKFQFSGTTNVVTVQTNGYLELNGPLSGSGNIAMKGNSTYGSNGKVWLNGDNSNFKGKIILSVGNATPNDTGIFQTLYVASGNNLGGALDEFAYDALKLEAYGLLAVTNSALVTLESGLNRGLYVNDVGRIRAEEGQTLRIDWPVTLNGTLRKEGEGDLLLGGEALFTPDGGVPSTTPTADANIVRVKAGGIGAASAEALDGMALQFEQGAKLVCKADTADHDLATRGLVNTKASTPFAVADGLDKIPVQITSDEIPTVGNFTVVVATVSAEQASAVQGLMGRVRLPAAWNGYLATWLEPTINGNDGTATLAVIVKSHGLRLLFR